MKFEAFRNRKGQLIDLAYHPSTSSEVLAILGHGITGNKDRPLLVETAKRLAKQGIPCLRLSFAGNGESDGAFADVTFTSECEDLIDLLEVYSPDTKIAYIGHSMGGAVGTLVAAEHPDRIQYLISLAGMVHTADFFQREFGDQTPDQGCMWEEEDCPLSQKAVDDANKIHDTLSAAHRVSQPWLLLHGTDDDVVPLSDSQDALDAAAGPSKLVEFPGEGHMFSEKSYDQIAEEIIAWIQQ